jgi:hypothetical protein
MRPMILLATAAFASLFALPAYAGPAEDAFLAKLTGAWTGSGTVTGEDEGAVSCTLTFKPTPGGEKFSGKCLAKGLAGGQSFSGTISYNDKTRKYEAGGNGQTSVGVKSGSSVVFTSDFKGMIKGTSVMKVSTSKILIDATIDRGRGKVSKSHVTFSK